MYFLLSTSQNYSFYDGILWIKEPILFVSDIFSFLFIVIFIVYSFIMKKKILRYIFAFFTVLSHIVLNLYILKDNEQNIFENIDFMIFSVNEQYYIEKLYIVPLGFVLMQFLIEAYFFYKKEQMKLQRYKRLKNFKANKK